MKKALLCIVVVFGGLMGFCQEKSQPVPKPQKIEEVKKTEAVKKGHNQLKEVPKVSQNQQKINKTQQQRKQAKTAQMQQRRSGHMGQRKKTIQRRHGHK